ncbi:hypothetical protein HDV00_005424 [Rhizophlyctis rosea]|nr:hypothetical protein HDV00_005424 [Rhizophlyctis rosea]
MFKRIDLVEDNNIKAYFDFEANPARAGDKLYQTTNIFSFCWHPPHVDDDSAASEVQPSKGSSHSRTLHLAKLDRDLADLRACFYTLPEPLTRIGFHRGFVFLVFDTAEDADAAMDHMQNDRNTRMIPYKVDLDYARLFVPHTVGEPLRSVMNSHLSIDPNAEEMERFFNCEAEATVALEVLNNVTNLKAVSRCRSSRMGLSKRETTCPTIRLKKWEILSTVITMIRTATRPESTTTIPNAKVASVAATISPFIRTSSKSCTSAQRAAAVLKGLGVFVGDVRVEGEGK